MSDNGPGATNPMLYDPIPESQQQISKKMQFVAAIGGKLLNETYSAKNSYFFKNIQQYALLQ